MIAVFIGGMLGGLGRYLLGRFPPAFLGTRIANMLACACLGVSIRNPEWQLAVGVGVAGALSTWSTLAGEIAELIKERRYVPAGTYLLATVLGGVITLTIY